MVHINKIILFLSVDREDRAILLIVRDFDTTEEWYEQIWDYRTAGNETEQH